jgi:hypothetical protein
MPDFVTYDGDDPAGYALACNIQRRSLTKGQVAMIAAKARKVSLQDASTYEVAKSAGTSAQRITQANVVLEHAPDLADAVIAGAVGLDKAYETARDRKTAAESETAQLERLRAKNADLAASSRHSPADHSQ